MAGFPNSTTAPEILRPTTDMTTFMERLLEPLPAEVLVDTQYNSLLRRARNENGGRPIQKLDTSGPC